MSALEFSGQVRLAPDPAPPTLAAEVRAQAGEVVALLGPNGAGKTTLLRTVAGLQSLAEGRITLAGKDLDVPGRGTWVAPHQRAVGVVFQDYRLFPAMSVLDNVAFGPRMRSASRPRARATARHWLDRLGLEPLATRRPGQLSGGQAQRVALARALASTPDILMLDEPLAALDVHARGEMRAELADYLRAFPGPALLVTHDPVDALILADRVVVLEGGRVVQDARPADLTRRPATAYIARLMGINHYAGELDPHNHRVSVDGGGTFVVAAEAGSGPPLAGRVSLAIRPSAVTVHREHPSGLSSRNVWPGRVRAMQLLGDRVRVDVSGAPDALVDLTPEAVADLQLDAARSVWLSVKATEIECYAAAGDHAAAPGE